MSFKLENFGADASNVKSILGGANYYRYFNKDNNTLTTPGYFPADLGLAVGDRITVIPATKTDADEEYIVSDITNRVVTVTKVETGLDTSKVVNADVLPTASADNLGYVYLYTGATDASHTHGYIYENKKTSTYTDSVTFEPATLSGTVVTATAGALSNLCAEYITGGITSIVSGTLVYLAAGDLWLLTGKDAEDNTVGSFQVYTPDYEAAGFTFTGTPEDGDVVAFTCSIEEDTVTYSWERIDVQPQPAKELPTQAGNSGKFLKTDGVSASWEAVGSLPDQTSQSGKFLITNGTDASWQKGLTNVSSRGDGIISLGNTTSPIDPGVNNSVVIISSDGSSISGAQFANLKNITSVGPGTRKCSGHNAVGIGGLIWLDGDGGVAIGTGSEVRAAGAIQISSKSQSSGGYSTATNSDANTFKVANANGNFELMNANGNLPADRLASTSGLTDGNYKLRLTISGGVATLSWVAE